MLAFGVVRRLTTLTGCLLLLVILSSHAQAQFARRTSHSESGLRSLGLEQVWHAQIQFDANRGRLEGITQHISNSSVQRVVEVTYPGGRVAFSERDPDPFKKPLGPKGARKKADEWVAAWQARSKSQEKPVIKEHVVPDVILLATTQRGVVQCLDGETGRTLWTTQVGTSRRPTTTACANENHVAVINGTTLYLLDRADGRLVWERPTSHTPGAGPAISDTLIFVPMVNGHVQVFNIDEPRRPAAMFYASGRCTMQPVIFRDVVAWSTDRGNVYVGNSEVPGIRFRISAGESISAPPTFRAGGPNYPTLLVFASDDGYIYAANVEKGGIVHRFSTGEPLSQSAVVVKDQVFAVTDSGTLFCTGADDGLQRWWTSGIKSFLAANFDRAYCLDVNNRIIGFDAKTGNILGTANLGSVEYAFENTASDRIYVATNTGVLQCLRETRQRYPLVHIGVERKKELPQALQNSSDTERPADTKEEKPADDNPFGAGPAEEKPAAPAGDNPFGEPETKDDKKPAMEEDPFG